MKTMREVLEHCRKQKHRVTLDFGSSAVSDDCYIVGVGDEIVELGNSPERRKDKRGQKFISTAAITYCHVCAVD